MCNIVDKYFEIFPFHRGSLSSTIKQQTSELEMLEEGRMRLGPLHLPWYLIITTV